MTIDRQGGDRLISGKLRGRAGRQGAATTVVVVDGVRYAWAHRHGWNVWGKGLRAISLSVALQPERTRELILDLTLPVDPASGPPSDARVAEALAAGIRSALQAGWRPETRGRAFRHASGG